MSSARISLVSQNPRVVGAQPARDFIGPPFPIGTLQPISGLIQLKSLNLAYCGQLTGTALFGHNQHMIHWLISSNWVISLANLLYLSSWTTGRDEFKAAHPNCNVMGYTG